MDLTSVDVTVLCQTWTWTHVSKAARPAGRPQGLGRFKGRPIEGWWCLRCKRPAQRRSLKSRECTVRTRTDSCGIKRHSAPPLIWRFWQRFELLRSFDMRDHRWRQALKNKRLLHWTNGAPGRCLPRWQWLRDVFLNRRSPPCGHKRSLGSNWAHCWPSHRIHTTGKTPGVAGLKSLKEKTHVEWLRWLQWADSAATFWLTPEITINI